MSMYEKLPEAQKRAYHVVDYLKKQGFDPALHEVYKHCVAWPENASHSLYDQLGLPADGYLKQPAEFGRMETALGKFRRLEQELLQRKGEQGKRDAAHKQREAELAEREAALMQRKGELDKREAALEPREAECATKQKKLQEAEKAAAVREAKPTERDKRLDSAKKSIQVRWEAECPSTPFSGDPSARPWQLDAQSQGLIWCGECNMLFTPEPGNPRFCRFHPGVECNPLS